jgi:hypothetical protein
MNLIDKIIEECEKALAEREKLKQSAKQFDKTYKQWTQKKER